ncbi:hypothetical protein [Streptomyces sp. 061-3]|uniref:hypothetical protein n=1 Tax=Streptomyces sp. 061-3 TaxID=2789268 RepID=UPI003980D3E1
MASLSPSAVRSDRVPIAHARAGPDGEEFAHDCPLTHSVPAPHFSLAQLLAVPDGLPRPEHFRVVRTPLSQPGEGEVLVRNRYFLVFPGLRTVVGGGVEGAPFPGAQPGDPLLGMAVGEMVTAASGAGGPRMGEPVSHRLGRREYAVVPRRRPPGRAWGWRNADWPPSTRRSPA